MKKKVILAIVCPLLAVVVAAAGFGYWYSSNTEPTDSHLPPTQPIVEQLESVLPAIPEEQIYMKGEMELSWMTDPSDTEKILSRASDAVRVRVLSAQKPLFVCETAGIPHIPLKVQILEVFSGDIKPGTQTVYFPGGSVTAEQYVKHHPSSAEKAGLLNFSKNELKKMYIEFSSEMDFDLKKNAEYVFLLLKDEFVPGEYFVLNGAYGTFHDDMKNVKSQKELKSTNAGKAKGANKGNIGNGQNKPVQ